MYKQLSDKKHKDLDPKIISWQRKSMGDETPLMYIYPQPGENIKKKNYFAVKDYEKALFYSKGKLMGVLGGGVFGIDKKAKIKGTEIIWIDTSINKVPWGVPQSNGIPTKDGQIIGLHGNMLLRISDVKTFYSQIAAGKETWLFKDLRNWIISSLQTSMRDIFKNYEAKNVILEDRERVINLITSKVTEEFMRYGLELETLNVLGIQAPEGIESLYRVERTKSMIADELEISKKKGELGTKKMEYESTKRAFDREQAELDAKAKLKEKEYLVEASRLEKAVDVEILEKEQKAKIAGDIAMIQVEGEKEAKIAKIKHEAELQIEKKYEEEKNRIEQKINELKEKLDQFDGMLEEGKISEDIYKTRINRIENELKDLERKL